MQPSDIGTRKVLLLVCATCLLTIGDVHAEQNGTSLTAQSGAPAATAAIDVTSADVQAAVKRGQESVKKPGALNDRLMTVADMGQYNIGVAMVVRTATATPTGAFSHLKVTEVYYILRGSGVQLTGTLVDGTGGGPDPLIGPTLGGRTPLQNARSSRLGPGDIQIIPPGVGHAWASIDEGGIEYLVYRVDPDHLLALPAQIRPPGMAKNDAGEISVVGRETVRSGSDPQRRERRAGQRRR